MDIRDVVVTDKWRLRLLEWAKDEINGFDTASKAGWSTSGVYDSELEFCQVAKSLALDGLE